MSLEFGGLRHGQCVDLALADCRGRRVAFGGKGKISDIMGDVAKGIKSFKKGLAEEDEKAEVQHPSDPPMRTIDHQTAADPDRKLG